MFAGQQNKVVQFRIKSRVYITISSCHPFSVRDAKTMSVFLLRLSKLMLWVCLFVCLFVCLVARLLSFTSTKHKLYRAVPLFETLKLENDNNKELIFIRRRTLAILHDHIGKYIKFKI